MRTRTIELEAWRRLDLVEQMANIGAEVGRTFNAKRQGQSDRFWGAIERAVDLFESTALAHDESERYRLKEVAGAKEEYLRIACAEPFEEADAARLEAYFMDFALMRRARGGGTRHG